MSKRRCGVVQKEKLREGGGGCGGGGDGDDKNRDMQAPDLTMSSGKHSPSSAVSCPSGGVLRQDEVDLRATPDLLFL